MLVADQPVAKIREIRTYVLKHRLSRRLRSARAWLQNREALLVEVITEDGVSGWGEAAGPAAVARAAIEHVLGPKLIGQDALDIGRHWHALYNATRESGRRGVTMSAISALDIALWDVVGRHLGLPIYTLLGGAFRHRLRAYATGFYFCDDEDPVQAAVEEAQRYAERGFTAMKIKLGLGPQTDLARVDAVRRVVGDSVLLLTDASRAYDLPTALRLGRQLQDRGVYWMEEPIAPEDLAGYQQMSEALDMAIAGGESEQTKYAFAEIVSRRAMDIIQPDTTRAGGITECRKIAALAEAWSVGYVPHVYGSAIGLAAALQLAAALPDFPASLTPQVSLFELVFEEGRSPLRDELATDPVRWADGLIQVPQGPGLGVEPDREQMRRFGAGD